MGEANVDVLRVRPYCVQSVISFATFLHGGSYQGFY